MPRKCILVLLDGAGDRSYRRLGHQTPLQAAATPVLDRLAALGCNGLYHPAAQGQALPSENAHFAMFGYAPEHFPGRGALEALGAGMALDKTTVAILAHLASLKREDRHLFLTDGKPSFSAAEAEQLFAQIHPWQKAGVQIDFTRTEGLRGILTLRGDVCPWVTDTDPVTHGRPVMAPQAWQAAADDPAAARTARALGAYLGSLYRRLEALPLNRQRAAAGLAPINGLLTQRAGRLKNAPPFEEQNGLRGLMLASGILYHGVGVYLGLDCRMAVDSADPGADLAERLTEAHQALDRYDFVHVHTKAPDEAAHTKDPLAKKRVLESLDRGISRAIAPLLADPELLIIATADHSTPSSGPLIHSGESVPLTFCGRGVRRDRVRAFDEISAAGGALGPVRGRELMYLILNHLDRAKLQGLMDTPVDQPYWPGISVPFRVDPAP
ncbi:MAG: alkaline phosphatase family protein [Desulfobacterales bacterium]